MPWSACWWLSSWMLRVPSWGGIRVEGSSGVKLLYDWLWSYDAELGFTRVMILFLISKLPEVHKMNCHCLTISCKWRTSVHKQ